MLGEVGDDVNENEDYSGREGDGAEIVEESCALRPVGLGFEDAMTLVSGESIYGGPKGKKTKLV